MRKLAAMLVALLGFTPALFAQSPASRPARGGGPPALNPALPTLWIAGDSTAASGERGWGSHLSDYFDMGKINIANRAVGGRSSRTFISGGAWDEMLSEFRPGDFVLIQFGHNDIHAINDDSRARGVIQTIGEETEPIDNLLTKQHEVVHTFGWYLRKMIADARSKGATPIVMSMTVRNNWTDGKVERGAGEMARMAIQLARAEKMQYVDLNSIVADDFEMMGQEKVQPLFQPDKTHSTVEGAEFNAAHITAGLKALKEHPLDQYLTDNGKSVAANDKYKEK